MKTLQERFDSKWEPEPLSGFWLCTSAVTGTPDKRGIIHVGRKNDPPVYAHRVAWQLYRGEIPIGLLVLHRCDTPLCVNPDHLFLGTTRDNALDCVAKGRWGKRNFPRGENHHNAKITEATVREIRQSIDTLVVCAERYGLHFGTVSDIRRRKTWRHIP